MEQLTGPCGWPAHLPYLGEWSRLLRLLFLLELKPIALIPKERLAFFDCRWPAEVMGVPRLLFDDDTIAFGLTWAFSYSVWI